MIPKTTKVRKDQPKVLEVIDSILDKIEPKPILTKTHFDLENDLIYIEFKNQEDADFLPNELAKKGIDCQF